MMFGGRTTEEGVPWIACRGCSRRRICPVVMFGGRTTDVRSALENI